MMRFVTIGGLLAIAGLTTLALYLAPTVLDGSTGTVSSPNLTPSSAVAESATAASTAVPLASAVAESVIQPLDRQPPMPTGDSPIAEPSPTPQRTPQPTSTALPTLTATPKPTATSTPAPTVIEIPPGWPIYKFINGAASFAYPPIWRKVRTQTSLVVFETPSGSLIMIGYAYLQEIADAKRSASSFEAYRDWLLARLKQMVIDSVDSKGASVSFELDVAIEGEPDSAWLLYKTHYSDGSYSFTSALSHVYSNGEMMMFFKGDTPYSLSSSPDHMLLGQVEATAVLLIDRPALYVDAAPGVPAQILQASNLRAWSDTESSLLGTLQPGETIEVLGRNEAGDWLFIRTSIGLEAWIAAFLVPGAPLSDLAVRKQ